MNNLKMSAAFAALLAAIAFPVAYCYSPAMQAIHAAMFNATPHPFTVLALLAPLIVPAMLACLAVWSMHAAD